MQIDFKVDRHDPVTEHDRAAEAAIRDFIFREVPDSTFMGEEGGSVGTGPVRWFVDPIDGTSNFARGLAFWCVSVGVMIGDKVVAGAIFDPVADNMFTGSAAGAFLNGKPMQSRAEPDEAHAVLITGYPVTRDFRLDGQTLALQRFGRLTETFATVRRPGSAALSIAHVAAGWVDAAAGFGVNPWDVTAAIAILQHAGGSYHPYSLGKVAEDAPPHLHPGYIALGAGAQYPVLRSIAAEISAGRTVARTAKEAPQNARAS
ncbi:inositol phosphatase [Cypionkella aquatica]|uniref:Inositol phosphatase n=2 Tax=Cypionkella aquatica TaxID=1756042 RepID=A0AA37TTP8_9RHOB|nr:inositol phosphatase [Cypionkella aquatica]